MTKPLPKLLVVVGPTASGKTDLAVALAKKFNGEVVSADSRLLYKGMDIGTAKPPRDKRKDGYFVEGVRHHLIDVTTPDKPLTLADYKRRALRAIRGILKRKKLPVLAGGTGLYVDAVVKGFEVPAVEPDPAYRRKLERMPRPKLIGILREKDPAYAARIGGNPRYAIRALEVIRATGRPFSELQKRGAPMFDALELGIRLPRTKLKRRIGLRTEGMVAGGLVDEAEKLSKRYDPTLPAMSGIGYREIFDCLNGKIGLEEASRSIAARTWQYARRQMTWFKRDKAVKWISGKNRAFGLVRKWLK